MSKLEETNELIETVGNLAELGVVSDKLNQAIFLDIAKSLAMIADTIYGTDIIDKCKTEQEET